MQKQAVISLAVVGTVACAAVFALSSFEAPSTSLFVENSDFAEYVAKYGKNYGTVEEFKYREELFNKKRAVNARVNARNENTFTVGINKFSDWSEAEYKKILGYKKPHTAVKNFKVLDTSNVTNEVDWRANGAVTDPKDQGQCGSCWAFSTTGALEGANAVAGNGLTEDSYPYTGTQAPSCQADGSGKVGASSHTDVTPNDPDQLRAAVSVQPVSIAIEADQEAFQGYSGGVLNSADCGTQLDHGVLIVGYGTEGEQAYWIVKNSWGSGWGENGYIRIADVAGEGICGINMAAVYPSI